MGKTFKEDYYYVEHDLKRVYDTVNIFKNIVDMDTIINYKKSKNKELLKGLWFLLEDQKKHQEFIK